MTDKHSQHSASGAAAVAHGHGGHGDGHGHTAPMALLIGVLGALIVLTVMTVGVTSVDLGSQGNFIVAMIVATVKAILVMGFFMHMFWDSKFNVIAFTSSFLFVMLFLSMAVLDRSEYRPNAQNFENDAVQAAKKP
jgi:cytochrome c oxidase subunit IV